MPSRTARLRTHTHIHTHAHVHLEACTQLKNMHAIVERLERLGIDIPAPDPESVDDILARVARAEMLGELACCPPSNAVDHPCSRPGPSIWASSLLPTSSVTQDSRLCGPHSGSQPVMPPDWENKAESRLHGLDCSSQSIMCSAFLNEACQHGLGTCSLHPSSPPFMHPWPAWKSASQHGLGTWDSTAADVDEGSRSLMNLELERTAENAHKTPGSTHADVDDEVTAIMARLGMLCNESSSLGNALADAEHHPSAASAFAADLDTSLSMQHLTTSATERLPDAESAAAAATAADQEVAAIMARLGMTQDMQK